MRSKTQSGNVVLEFALCSIFLVPLTLGVSSVGLGIAKYLQGASVCRSAASMFVRGADFSKASFQRMLARISDGMGVRDGSGDFISTSSGRGVVILSLAMRVGGPQCEAGGFPSPSYTGCTNLGAVVFTKRVVVGNSSLRTSRYGTPSPTIINQHGDADGTIRPDQYLTAASAVLAAFGVAAADDAAVAGSPVDLRAGELAYIAETYFVAPELNIFPRFIQMPGYYSAYIY